MLDTHLCWRPVIYHLEPTGTIGYCLFCFEPKSSSSKTCSYGLQHEFPVEKVAQTKRPRKGLCVKCGLHKNNPSSSTNGCEHQYEE
jgi:hypothetical protein